MCAARGRCMAYTPHMHSMRVVRDKFELYSAKKGQTLPNSPKKPHSEAWTTWLHSCTRCIQPHTATWLCRGPAGATTTLPVEGPSRTSYIPPPTPLQRRRGGASYEKALLPSTHANMRAAPATLRSDPLSCHCPDSPVGAPLGYVCPERRYATHRHVRCTVRECSGEGGCCVSCLGGCASL